MIVFAGTGYPTWRSLLPVQHILGDDMSVFVVGDQEEFDSGLRHIVDRGKIDLLITPISRKCGEFVLPQYLKDIEFPILMVRSTCIDSRPAFRYGSEAWANRRVYKTLPTTWPDWCGDAESIHVNVGSLAHEYWYYDRGPSCSLDSFTGCVLVILPSGLTPEDSDFITKLIEDNPSASFIIKDRPYGEPMYKVPQSFYGRGGLLHMDNAFEVEELISVCSMVVAPKYLYSASHYSAAYFHMYHRPIPIVWFPYNTTSETRHHTDPSKSRELGVHINEALEAGLFTEGSDTNLETYVVQSRGDEAVAALDHIYGGQGCRGFLSEAIRLLASGKEEELLARPYVQPYFTEEEKSHYIESITHWATAKSHELDMVYDGCPTDDRWAIF
jgi:hypothetical protein